MFEPKDVISDAVASAVKIITPRKRGEIIAWEQIETAAGFGRESPHWGAFNKRMRRQVRQDTGIVLWPVNGIGLKLLSTEEQLHMRSIARQRRAIRQMTRDLVELKALPDKELSDHQRTVKYRKIDQGRTARRAVLYSDKLAHMLSKPSTRDVPRTPRSK